MYFRDFKCDNFSFKQCFDIPREDPGSCPAVILHYNKKQQKKFRNYPGLPPSPARPPSSHGHPKYKKLKSN